MSSKLTKEQVEVLYEHRRISESGDATVIVPKSAVDQVRAVLEDALRERGVSDPSSMTLEALGSQFVDDDDRSEAANTLSSQHPETGSTVEANAAGGEGFSVESLSASDVGDFYRRRKLIDSLESRTPEHASELKEELAEDMGLGDDVESLPSKKELQKLIDK